MDRYLERGVRISFLCTFNSHYLPRYHPPDKLKWSPPYYVYSLNPMGLFSSRRGGATERTRSTTVVTHLSFNLPPCHLSKITYLYHRTTNLTKEEVNGKGCSKLRRVSYSFPQVVLQLSMV